MRHVMALYWVPFRPILCPQSVALDKRSTETRAWGRTALLLWVRKARRKESFLCSSWLAVLYTSEKHSALKGDGLSLIKDTHTHTQTSPSDSSFPSRLLKKAVGRSRTLYWREFIYLLSHDNHVSLAKVQTVRGSVVFVSSDTTGFLWEKKDFSSPLFVISETVGVVLTHKHRSECMQLLRPDLFQCFFHTTRQWSAEMFIEEASKVLFSWPRKCSAKYLNDPIRSMPSPEQKDEN